MTIRHQVNIAALNDDEDQFGNEPIFGKTDY